MGQTRVTIAGLMILVAIVAIELAALRFPSEASVDVCRFLTVTTLIVATLRARQANFKSPFWFGFALLGWVAYVVVIDATSRGFDRSIVSRLPRMYLDATVDPMGYTAGLTFALENQNKLRILHHLLVIPTALIGGLLLWGIESQGRRRVTRVEPAQPAKPPSLADAPSHPDSMASGETVFDVLDRAGLIGCLKSASGTPDDLSTNLAHMEGFGRE